MKPGALNIIQCLCRKTRHVDFTLHFGSWDWVFLLFCKIALFLLFSERLHFPLECVCWVLLVAQFASPAFPTKKWVERGGNTIATIMNHCNARNIITKWLSSSIDNQSSLCGFYIPIAFPIYLIILFVSISSSLVMIHQENNEFHQWNNKKMIEDQKRCKPN